jgi:hypothetical protein
VGQPLIHLGFAYELNNSVLAVEALGLCAANYDFLHKYLDNPPSNLTSNSNPSILIILADVKADSRFDGLFTHPGSDNIELLFEKHEYAVLEYWKSWEIEGLRDQFKESMDAAILLLLTTHKPSHPAYDLLFVRLLTASYAVRVLLPIVPAEWQIPLVQEWWLLVLVVYIVQFRPKVNEKYINDYNLKDRSWSWVDDRALKGQYSKDSQFVAG